MLEVSDVQPGLLEQYEIIGFWSGIYFGKHHEKLFELLDTVNLSGKNVFLFSTSGTGSVKYKKKLADALVSKGAVVKSSFVCKGYDTYGVLMVLLMGGQIAWI